MPDMTYPKRGRPVSCNCIFCDRLPITGETYGPNEGQWDHTGICPECWDKTCADPDDES
jgi:hypothetical protein